MKRTIFIGQAMPKFKRNPHDWPSLNTWLHSVGITDHQIKKNFLYTALVNYFPGSKNGTHLVPTAEEISKEKDRLKQAIRSFNPEIIVPIGRLSIAYCFGKPIQPLEKFVGQMFKVDPYNFLGRKLPIIPLAHPSGASTWRHSRAGKKLLPLALKLLKKKLYD